MRKHILSAVSFLLILALIIAGLSLVFCPKNNTREAGIREPQANGFLAEPENTLDVLVLGNSEGYCAVNPMEIWQSDGITTYVCGSSDQKLYQAESYLRAFLKNQSPKVVILETLAIYSDYSRGDALPEILGEWIPILRYHNRWKTLQWTDWYAPVRYTAVRMDKGFHDRRDTVPADSADVAVHMAPDYTSAAIPRKNRKHVKNIRDICHEHGAELVLISTPSVVNWDTAHHNGIATLAEQMDLRYIDMNLLEDEIGLDWQTDTVDGGDHMNLSGSQKVSAYLAQWLTGTGLFTDKRKDPDYEAWNRFLGQYLVDTPDESGYDK